MNTHSLSRRDLLRSAAWAGVGGKLLAGTAVHAGTAAPSLTDTSTPPLPPLELQRRNPEAYWGRIRSEQFELGEKRVFLNPGSLGVIPKPVLEAVMKGLHRQAQWPTDDAPRWGYETLDDERSTMASFLGCRKEELAFTHNSTEAMSYVASGLDLKAGDEVILTNQEHPGGYSAWRMRAARTGVVVKEVEIPVTPSGPAELHDRLIQAIGPKTRVLMFSGITSPTGLVLPTRELCESARTKGVISVVDGAHMDGQTPVDLHSLGCDYFTGSPHKWLFAPAGCGLLYGRGDALDHLWPTVCNAGWDKATEIHGARFMMIGTNNRAIIDGMMAGLRLFREIGEEAIYARQRQLSRRIVERVLERPYVELVTPNDERMFRAMVSIHFKETELTRLFAAMKEAGIYVIGGPRSRLSANVYSRPSDIDAFFDVCDRFLKR